ncbi:MAG: A/G-specific adenine glycosylase [Crocinitomix sp.]|nr:A/G-specific adenine glycosylase [Crocinitomix sp.]
MADFSTLINAWYRQNRRVLPWRGISDPYKIWLSEVILQQTRVDQGTAYYLKFIKAFPTINHLANAEEDEVLNLWQGLGYYSRARNMHFSAKLVANELNGVFPTTYKGVISLKGVGEYTAAAITSIAYGLPHAVVDGNVYRVLSRYLAIATPIDSKQGKKEFAEVASAFLDHKNPGDHNQALMEIGALICLPKKPKCSECPLSNSCVALQKKSQLNFPVKSKKTKVVNRYIHYLVFTDGQNTALKKRTGKGIWEGLYDFPMVEKKEGEELTKKDLESFTFSDFTFDGTFKHILSHQKILATFWQVQVEQVKLVDNQIEIPIHQIEDYPLPQLLIRYIKESRLFGAD